MPDIAWLNGRFMPLADAKVSVEDRGLQFGDGVYEVIRTYGGRPFQLEAHLDRLESSAKAIELTSPYARGQWVDTIQEALRLAGYPESKVYLQVTRGTAPRDHAFPVPPSPTAILTVRELHPISSGLRAQGVAAITLDDLRWGRCDIKSVNLLPNVLARQQAKAAGAFEAIFVRQGRVTEGAVSNVMIVHDRVLTTAPQGEQILSGVTRKLVLDWAREDGVSVREDYVSVEALYGATEVFLTGTTVEVLGLVRIDGRVIGSGAPGALSQRLAQRFPSLAD